MRVGATIVLLVLQAAGASSAERHYLVAGRGTSLPSPQAIAAAGGTWTGQIESIGVALARSANPDFLDLVTRDPSVEMAAPDVEVRLPEVDMESMEMTGPTEGLAAAPEAAGQGSVVTSNDPLSVLEWDNAVLGLVNLHARGIRGQGVTVAVVDAGIDKTHPDLAAAVIETGISFLPSDPSPFPTSGGLTTQGHGTAVAGIIAAACDNGIGVCGVAPGARLLSVRVSDGVNPFPISRILQAYDWASNEGVALYGVRVINASHGAFCSDTDPSCREGVTQLLGIANRMIAEVYRRGVALFAAAGNEGVDVSQSEGFKTWPAGNKAETVGATGPCCAACDHDPLNDANYDLLAGYSNRGFAENYFVMPGGQRPGGPCSYPPPNICTVATPLGTLSGPCQRFDMIWTTSLLNPQALAGRYIPFSGTSAAVPQASGLAALWLSRFPNLKVGALVDALHASTVDLGLPGYDLLFGYGRGNPTAIPVPTALSMPLAPGTKTDATRDAPQSQALRLTARPSPYRGGSLVVSFAAGHDGANPRGIRVGIYDLAGRRIRLLTPAVEGIASLTFSWDGRDGNGAVVHDGIYFLRASGDGPGAELKLVVMR